MTFHDLWQLPLNTRLTHREDGRETSYRLLRKIDTNFFREVKLIKVVSRRRIEITIRDDGQDNDWLATLHESV